MHICLSLYTHTHTLQLCPQYDSQTANPSTLTVEQRPPKAGVRPLFTGCEVLTGPGGGCPQAPTALGRCEQGPGPKGDPGIQE